MMKILLLGADGQLGWQLRRSLVTLGPVVALTRRSTPCSGDLLDGPALALTVSTLRPDVVVNAAAYTDVDQAESDRRSAFATNADACAVLAHASREVGAWLVHFSTDYVYDGSGNQPWRESDATGPLNVYGASKLAGDAAIEAHQPQHLIFRTAWLFDSWGTNFAKRVLQRACAETRLDMVCDQWGAPTRAALVADVTACALHRIRTTASTGSLAGTYHVAASGATTRDAYARHLLAEGLACGLPLKVTPDQVRPVASSNILTPARRPLNSRLDTSRLRQTFGVDLPDWTSGVSAVVAELANHHRTFSLDR